MPIIGLTDRGPTLPEIGVLRKGAPKPESGNKPGRDLEYFRFDTHDAAAEAAFRAAYGETPTTIRVFVPFRTTDENFEAWREEWSASSLRHRCDGQTCVLWLGQDGKYHAEARPCPGGCKQVGRLRVIIPELRRLATVCVQTTSAHDIVRIHGGLSALEKTRGSLQGIPLLLKRTPHEISTPAEGGKRARRTKWLLSIEAQQQWVEMQLASAEQSALPATPQLPLPPPADEDEGDEALLVEQDFIAEARDAWLRVTHGDQSGWEEYYGKNLSGQSEATQRAHCQRVVTRAEKALREQCIECVAKLGLDAQYVLASVGVASLDGLSYVKLIEAASALTAAVAAETDRAAQEAIAA